MKRFAFIFLVLAAFASSLTKADKDPLDFVWQKLLVELEDLESVHPDSYEFKFNHAGHEMISAIREINKELGYEWDTFDDYFLSFAASVGLERVVELDFPVLAGIGLYLSELGFQVMHRELQLLDPVAYEARWKTTITNLNIVRSVFVSENLGRFVGALRLEEANAPLSPFRATLGHRFGWRVANFIRGANIKAFTFATVVSMAAILTCDSSESTAWYRAVSVLTAGLASALVSHRFFVLPRQRRNQNIQSAEFALRKQVDEDVVSVPELYAFTEKRIQRSASCVYLLKSREQMQTWLTTTQSQSD